MTEQNKVGIRIDLTDSNGVSSAILEELVISVGFNPSLDIPLCIEYFDSYNIETSINNLCALIALAVRGEEPEGLVDDEYYNSIGIIDLTRLIEMACKELDIDPTKLLGISLVWCETNEAIVAWFNNEDLPWKQPNS